MYSERLKTPPPRFSKRGNGNTVLILRYSQWKIKWKRSVLLDPARFRKMLGLRLERGLLGRIAVQVRLRVGLLAHLRGILEKLEDEARFGAVLRAKGIVDSADGQWLYFDYVPGEVDLRRGQAAVTGRFCVIGSKLNETALKELFRLG